MTHAPLLTPLEPCDAASLIHQFPAEVSHLQRFRARLLFNIGAALPSFDHLVEIVRIAVFGEPRREFPRVLRADAIVFRRRLFSERSIETYRVTRCVCVRILPIPVWPRHIRRDGLPVDGRRKIRGGQNFVDGIREGNEMNRHVLAGIQRRLGDERRARHRQIGDTARDTAAVAGDHQLITAGLGYLHV